MGKFGSDAVGDPGVAVSFFSLTFRVFAYENRTLDHIHAFTAMVDKKPSRAASYVNGVEHVLEILQPLAAASRPPAESESSHKHNKRDRSSVCVCWQPNDAFGRARKCD